MDERIPAKHQLARIFLFSFLGGLFGALIVLLMWLYGFAMGWLDYPRQAEEVTRSVVGAFLSLFFVILIWYLKLYAVERFAERAGSWQALPRWLQSSTKVEEEQLSDERREPSKRGSSTS